MLEPLKHGDKIAVVALARKVNLQDLLPAIEIMESWGLEVVMGKTLIAEYHIFAGTDAERAADLQFFLDDPDIKAIISARGGYGTTRIIDLIDFSKFEQAPKWIVGFSDITALLCHVHGLGIQSIHAIMPALFTKPGSEESVETLRQVLMGEEINYPLIPSHSYNRTGKATGQLVGGNISLLASISGTSSDVQYAGKILFLEEVEEYLYSLDRMVVHLKRNNKLANLAGLIVGHMTNIQDNPEPFGKDAYEIIQEHTQEYNYPVCFGFPVGHEPKNLALVLGREAQLLVNESGSALAYTDVELKYKSQQV